MDQSRRQAVWDEISRFLYDALGRPASVLDPAAGRGEFVKAVPAKVRWVVDAVEHADAGYPADVVVVVGDILEVELPDAHFEGILASNLLEHFASQHDVARFLRRMLAAAVPGGRIAVMGPNFRYCAGEYFDCADHTVPLTHVSVAEHLHAAGWEVERIVPRFIPYSFRSALPASPALTRLYLRTPRAWRLLGKQFLVVGRRPDA